MDLSTGRQRIRLNQSGFECINSKQIKVDVDTMNVILDVSFEKAFAYDNTFKCWFKITSKKNTYLKVYGRFTDLVRDCNSTTTIIWSRMQSSFDKHSLGWISCFSNRDWASVMPYDEDLHCYTAVNTRKTCFYLSMLFFLIYSPQCHNCCLKKLNFRMIIDKNYAYYFSY